MDYLSPSEQSKIRNNGKLGNSTVVKKQLNKYFYYVSIRNRGKEVRIGKPKFNFKDDVDEAIQSVIYGSIDLNARSLSSWYRTIGINLISMEEIEKYAKELYGKEKLVFWRVYGYIQEAKRSMFERSWRRAINQIGGYYEMTYMVYINPDSEIAKEAEDYDSENNIKYYFPLPDEIIDEYKLLLQKLRGDGIKSPIAQRKSKKYKEWLKDRSFEAVWRAYNPDFNVDNLALVKRYLPLLEKQIIKERCMDYIHNYVKEKAKIEEDYLQYLEAILFVTDDANS